HNQLKHITSISRIAEEEYVWMDRFTSRNLELYRSNSANAVTLIDVIDKTISPMGGRLLKRWLALPLKNIEKIKQRHEVVHFLLQNNPVQQKLRQHIEQIADIERLISKIATGKINHHEVVQLKNSLESIIHVKSLAESNSNYSLKAIGNSLHTC